MAAAIKKPSWMRKHTRTGQKKEEGKNQQKEIGIRLARWKELVKKLAEEQRRMSEKLFRASAKAFRKQGKKQSSFLEDLVRKKTGDCIYFFLPIISLCS